MSLHGRSVLITLAALCAVSLAALGLSAPAGAANPFYADCVSCHAMPVTQAEGLDRHSISPQPPPGTIQDLCF